MAPRITDGQKKKIIADYVNLESYNAVGKMHGISPTTVKKIVLENKDIVEKCEQKKNQNTMDMLSYMESRKKRTQDILDNLLDAMSDPDKLNRASLVQIGTVYGILVDKSIGSTGIATEEHLARLENIKVNTAKLKGEDRQEERDDGFMDALKAEVADVWQE